MLDIGRLNKRITFCRYVETENELGQCVQALEEVKTVWATVEPTTGKEYYDAQKVRNEQTWNIYTRYFIDINTDMKIKYKERLFNIISVINYREGNEMLKIVCTERVMNTK